MPDAPGMVQVQRAEALWSQGVGHHNHAVPRRIRGRYLPSVDARYIEPRLPKPRPRECIIKQAGALAYGKIGKSGASARVSSGSVVILRRANVTPVTASHDTTSPILWAGVM